MSSSDWRPSLLHGIASQFSRNHAIFRLGIEVANLSLRDDADTPSTSTSTSTKAWCEDEDGHEHKNGCPWIGPLAPVFHLTNRGFCDSAAERR